MDYRKIITVEAGKRGALVIEHIKASELPRTWAERLDARPEETFTVRIEPEARGERGAGAGGKESEAMPAFGMWRDFAATENVEIYARSLRTRRY